MAHKTRRRLTKTELKKDPVNEFLFKTMTFLRDNLKVIASVLGGMVIVTLIVQSLSSSSARQSDESVAGFFLAGQLYELGMSSFQSGQYDTAMSQLQTARSVAQNNYRAYSGRDSGRWSMLLQAKIGIIFGLEDEVIPQLQEFLATRPSVEFADTGRLYLATALSNRGGGADAVTARGLYEEVLASADSSSQLAWEAFNGLARLDFASEDFQAARQHLNAAFAIFPDTTEFMEYQLARLDLAGF